QLLADRWGAGVAGPVAPIDGLLEAFGVPEPTTLVYLFLGAGLLGRRRRPVG
ncbi:MAG: PEP-CTERM sorting domain-containing protein, partial [Phycisphaerales bacterium]|nr:PEP-CTERM sorting domain-containing protein [Phycisphaerales bacterium]